MYIYTKSMVQQQSNTSCPQCGMLSKLAVVSGLLPVGRYANDFMCELFCINHSHQYANDFIYELFCIYEYANDFMGELFCIYEYANDFMGELFCINYS